MCVAHSHNYRGDPGVGEVGSRLEAAAGGVAWGQGKHAVAEHQGAWADIHYSRVAVDVWQEQDSLVFVAPQVGQVDMNIRQAAASDRSGEAEEFARSEAEKGECYLMGNYRAE